MTHSTKRSGVIQIWLVVGSLELSPLRISFGCGDNADARAVFASPRLFVGESEGRVV